MSKQQNPTQSSGSTAREVIEQRLEEAGIDPTAVNVDNGTKVSRYRRRNVPANRASFGRLID